MQKASNKDDWRNINDEGWGVTLTDKNSTTAITTIPCTTINDIPIVTMSHMFYNSKATKVDLSKFNTTNVTDMSNMFSISDFASLDLTSWNVQKTKYHKDFNLDTETKVKEPIWIY